MLTLSFAFSWGPADEAQFEIMDTVHAVYLLMRSHRENILFAAPLKNPRRILDLGTGPGMPIFKALLKIYETH